MSGHLESEDELVLAGGTMGGAVRVGATVRRPAGPWSATVQRLLRHLRDHGTTWAPEPLGTDEQGRDRVSYILGVVPQYPMPSWVWAEGILVDAAGRLAQLHRASAGFDTTAAVWQLPVHEPAEVVCHNDVAPYNMVFRDGRVVGVIDWDTASPGPRVWDVAYLAYRLVPLTEPTGEATIVDPDQRLRRLGLLCDAYGHGLTPADVLRAAVGRLHELAAFTETRADSGHEDLRSHVALYRRDARWIAGQADRLGRGDP